jgi:hypothetical protein
MKHSSSRFSASQVALQSSRQLCSSLLHNWDLNTHPYLERFHPQGMKPPGVLL